MKKAIVAVMSFLLKWIDGLLVALGITKPKVIIYMDGGICSQMQMYAQGQYYNNGKIRVYYDIEWYSKNGKDMDGVFDRRLELQEMFPEIDFPIICGHKRKIAFLFFRHCNSFQMTSELPRPNEIKRTTYFYGYYDLNQIEYDAVFNSCFGYDKRREISKTIKAENGEITCAVHCRRGDLANRETECYKKPKIEYFIESINYVNMKYDNVRFYLFSDEIDWVERNICPCVKVNYCLMKRNKGFEDLLLISRCDVIIASQGSFGIYGAKLNPNSILITPASFYESFCCSNNIQSGENPAADA